MESHTHLYEDKYLDLRRSLLFLQCFEGKDTRSFSRELVMKQISFRDIDGYSITIYDSGLKVSILDEHLA